MTPLGTPSFAALVKCSSAAGAAKPQESSLVKGLSVAALDMRCDCGTLSAPDSAKKHSKIPANYDV